MPVPKDSCGICYGDPVRKHFVETELAKGTPHTQIELKSRELSLNVKRETIRRHLSVCVQREAQKVLGYVTDPAPSPVQSGVPGSVASPTTAPGTPVTVQPGQDFAALVRDEAAKRLAAGELVIKAEHGLMAQSIIDKRVEKAKDRDLMIQMGKLLGGQNSPQPPVIEGEYKDVTPMPLAITSGE